LSLKCGKNEDKIYKELKHRMDLVVKSHLIKKSYIQSIIDTPNSPLKFYREGSDGKPYEKWIKYHGS
jgi:hypothetical protein